MPKAARRTSGPKTATRTKPYPAIKPGDKPTTSTSSTQALAERSSKELNKPTTKPTDGVKSDIRPDYSRCTGSYLEVTIEGEESNSVRIYDTCSEVRRKINSLLGKDNNLISNRVPGEFYKDGMHKPWTKAAFCRQIGCSTRQLDTFMKAKKLMGGAESDCYPGAYKFFEKKRIFEKKKKTPGRLKIEAESPNGLALIDPNKVRVWCRLDENPAQFLNKYGQ